MLSQLSSKYHDEEHIAPLLLNSRLSSNESSVIDNETIQNKCPREAYSNLEIFAAEFLGTMLLLFFGCLGLFSNASQFDILAPMQGGIVFGFVVGSIIACIGHISEAHLNPAVTLCSYLLEKTSVKTASVYFLAELLGSLTGFWLLKEVVPQKLFSAYANNSSGFCTTVLHSTINPYQGFLIEFLGTSFLILIVCSSWDPRNLANPDTIPIKFGLFIAAAAITMGPFTGCGLNPTRSFAPALINKQWANHWIYWLAPISASVITTSFYKHCFMRSIALVGKQDVHQLLRCS